MSITKAELQNFRKHMVKCAKEAGVDLKIGSITFSDGYFSFSSKGYIIGGNGKQEEFNRYAAKKGVPSSWYMQKFIIDSETFTITGIKPRGRKNVLEITRDDGKSFVCSVGYVRSGTFVSQPTTPLNVKRIV